LTATSSSQTGRREILVLHGPNLNLLGTREPETYGSTRLADIDAMLTRQAEAADYGVRIFQSNHEGELVDLIQTHGDRVAGVLINPAALTHTSVALRDAFLAVEATVVEVHLSNTHRREAFRHHSYLADIAIGQVMGFGSDSYRLGMSGLIGYLERTG